MAEKQLRFLGEPSRGLGLSFLPQSFLKIESFGTDVNFKTPKQNLPGTLLRHRVIESWVSDEQGNIPKEPDNSLVGMTFEHLIMDPTPNPTTDKELENYKRAEASIKTAIIAHGGPREAVDAAKDMVSVKDTQFDGKTAYLIYTPPPEGAQGNDNYPTVKYVRPHEVNDLKSGIKRVPWADKKAKSGANVQVAGGPGQFIAGAPAGQAGMPAGFMGGAQPAGAQPQNGGGNPIGGFMGGAGGAAPAQGSGPAPQSW